MNKSMPRKFLSKFQQNYVKYSILTIWHELFLEFWLVNTWFFAHSRDQRAATSLENVRQLNKRRGEKLGFYLSNRQPLTKKLAKTNKQKKKKRKRKII